MVHDESTFYSGEDESKQWVEAGRGHALKRKNLGGSINSSRFLSEWKGQLRMTDEEFAEYKRVNPQGVLPQDSGIEMRCGTKYSTANGGCPILGQEHDGWWTNKLMLAQLKQAIKIFDITHPGKQGLFLFDNSTGHNAYAADALLAHKMGCNPSGKQPFLRATEWKGERQSMQFEEGQFLLHDCCVKVDGEKHKFKRGVRVHSRSLLLGLQKGARQVALERKLPIYNGRTKAGKCKFIRHCCPCCKKTEAELLDDELLRAAGCADQIVDKIKHKGRNAQGVPCCVVWALSQCEDFLAQKNAVEECVQQGGHEVIFLPKFHPELNFIERFWGHAKRWLRSHCLYTMEGLWNNLGKVCSADITPVSLLRKFARTSWRWMDVYRRGLPPAISAFAAKQYHGHRCVPPTMDALVDEFKAHKRKAAAVKLESLIAETSLIRRPWTPTSLWGCGCTRSLRGLASTVERS